MNAASCPSKEALLGYHTGSVPEDVAQAIAAHLTTCRECEQTAQSLEAVPDPLVIALREQPPEDILPGESDIQEVLEKLRRGGEEPGDIAPASGGSLPSMSSSDLVGDNTPSRNIPPAGGENTSTTSWPRLATTLGDYELLKKLGQGGMGAVYMARHVKLKRVVALKVLLKNRLGNPEALARFEREMEAVGRLDHPHIVRAMDAREVGGIHFLVMEYVDGLDLAKVVRRVGPLSIADACEVVRQAALGLQCADENSLVHRDIKPSNLMLTSEGQVKVMDLGLAQIHRSETLDGDVTSLDQVMGTPDYISPEQAVQSHGVDIRTDIYSLGCTLYYLLVGRPPYDGPEYDTPMKKVAAHIYREIPRIEGVRRGVSKPVAAILEQMLCKEPGMRLATPTALIAALSPYCGGSNLIALLHEARRKGLTEHERQASTVSMADLHASVEVRIKAAEQPKSPVSELRVQQGRGAPAEVEPPSPLGRPGFRFKKPPAKYWVPAALAGFLILLGIVLFISTGKGQIRIALNDPKAQVDVKVDGRKIEIAGLDEPLQLSVGEHELTVTGPKYEAIGRSFTVHRGKNRVLEVTLVPLVSPPPEAPSPAMTEGPRPQRPTAISAQERPKGRRSRLSNPPAQPKRSEYDEPEVANTVPSQPPSIRLGKWVRGPDLPALTWGAAAVLKGKFYVVGGQLGNGTHVQVYDPAADAWSRAPDLPRGVFGQGLIAHNGYLYCFGGTVAEDKNWWGRPTEIACRYDPRSSTWTALPGMPRPRADFLIGVVGGKIYCIGGSNHWPKATNAVDVYDPVANTWSSAPDLPVRRGNPRGGTYQNDVISVWGLSTAHTTDNHILKLDPASGGWSQTGIAADSGFGETGMFLFSNRDGMYFAGLRNGRKHETWISLFRPESGLVDYVAKAPENRATAVGAFDPERSTIYLAGGSNAAGPVAAFEYVQVTADHPR